MKTIEPSTEITTLISQLKSIADALQTLSQNHPPNQDRSQALRLKTDLIFAAKELSIKATEEHLYCKLEALLTDRERDDPENHHQVIERLNSHIMSESHRFSQFDFDH